MDTADKPRYVGVLGNAAVKTIKPKLTMKWRKEIKHYSLLAGKGNPPYRIEVFEKHYANAAKASKIPKRIGTGLTVIDLGIRADTIYEACTAEPGTDANCTKTVYEQTGGFVLSGVGGRAGGLAGGAVCAALAPTVVGGIGCVVIVGATGVLLGGWAGDKVGNAAGAWAYETIHE